MNIKHIIGALMLIALAIAGFIGLWRLMGIKEAIKAYLFTICGTAFILLAVYLLQ